MSQDKTSPNFSSSTQSLNTPTQDSSKNQNKPEQNVASSSKSDPNSANSNNSTKAESSSAKTGHGQLYYLYDNELKRPISSTDAPYRPPPFRFQHRLPFRFHDYHGIYPTPAEIQFTEEQNLRRELERRIYSRPPDSSRTLNENLKSFANSINRYDEKEESRRHYSGEDDRRGERRYYANYNHRGYNNYRGRGRGYRHFYHDERRYYDNRRDYYRKEGNEEDSKHESFKIEKIDEYDLSIELHPLIDFIEDKPKLLAQAFSILHGKKLAAMLPQILKNKSLEQLQRICGKELDSLSIATIANVIDGKMVNAELTLQQEVSKKGKKKGTENALKKVKKKLKETINEEESSHKKKSKKHKKKKKKEKNKKVAAIDDETPAGPGLPPQKTLMELLELEYRAKAIKALLKSNGVNSSGVDDALASEVPLSNDTPNSNNATPPQDQNPTNQVPVAQNPTNEKPVAQISTNQNPVAKISTNVEQLAEISTNEKEAPPPDSSNEGAESKMLEGVAEALSEEKEGYYEDEDLFSDEEKEEGARDGLDIEIGAKEPNALSAPKTSNENNETGLKSANENEGDEEELIYDDLDDDGGECGEVEPVEYEEGELCSEEYESEGSGRNESSNEGEECYNLKGIKSRKSKSRSPDLETVQFSKKQKKDEGDRLSDVSEAENIELIRPEDDSSVDSLYEPLRPTSSAEEVSEHSDASIDFNVEGKMDVEPVSIVTQQHNTNVSLENECIGQERDSVQKCDKVGEVYKKINESLVSTMPSSLQTYLFSESKSEKNEEILVQGCSSRPEGYVESNDLEEISDEEEEGEIDDEEDEDENKGDNVEEEEDNPRTWFNKWYNSKRVQRDVKSSLMCGRVRSKLKRRREKEEEVEREKERRKVDELGNVPVIGSIAEYEKLLSSGKFRSSVIEKNKEEEEEEEKKEEEEDEDEDDEIWGDILGKDDD